MKKPHDNWDDEPSDSPHRLDYQGRDSYYDVDSASPASQFGHGFLLSMCACLIDFLLIGPMRLINIAAVIIVLTLVAVIAVCITMHVRLGWRSFLPGVLLGFGITCLVPYATVWVICGMGRPLIH